nr:MAG: RNA-dependent RNA polymerase [Wenzhou bat nodavirus 3]
MDICNIRNCPSLLATMSTSGSVCEKIYRRVKSRVCNNKLAVAAGVVTLAGAIFWRKRAIELVKREIRWGASVVADAVSDVTNTGVRREFNENLDLVPVRQIDAHSHPAAASARTQASRAIDNFACSLGYTVYSVSRSERDAPRGQRLFYHTKDFVQHVTNDTPNDMDIIKMVDVDYYCDMDYWLSFGRPVLIYTFVPRSAGGVVPNGSYSIDDNHIVMRVAGGAIYRHRVWDYAHDWITVDTLTGVYVCSIDQVALPQDPERRIICIVPQRFIPAPMSLMVPRNPLKRVRFTYGDCAVVSYLDEERGPTLSLSLGGGTSVTLAQDLYHAIRVRFHASKHKNIADIERFFTREEIPRAYVPASALYELLQHEEAPIRVSTFTSCGVKGRNPHYQTVTALVCEDGSEYAREVAPPLCDPGAVVPVRSLNNDVQTVHGRVEKVQNSKTPPTMYHQYAREFVDHVVGDIRCAPLSYDDVIELQDRPAQRQRSEQARMWFGWSRFFVKAFQKKEAYSSINDPRNISTCTTDHTLRLSSYTLAFKETILKRFKWYFPGLSPDEITSRLRDGAVDATELLATDYSRLDGTISAWLRKYVERAVYLRAFGGDPELRDLLREELNPRAVTAMGYAYEPGHSRLSGSPLTTDGNTLICAFADFVAFRESGRNPREALGSILAVYGDDGVKKGLQAHVVEKVADNLGLKLKCTVVPRHAPVPFLGRVFCDLWTTNASVQDPIRTLTKIHLSMTPDAVCSAELAATHKASGYLQIDARTPLIGEYCRAVLRVLGADPVPLDPNLNLDIPWFARQFGEGCWQQSDQDRGLMEQVVADSVKLSVAEVREICEALNQAQSFAEFPVGRIKHELEVKVPAVLGGELLVPPTDKPTQPDPPRRDSVSTSSSSEAEGAAAPPAVVVNNKQPAETSSAPAPRVNTGARPKQRAKVDVKRIKHQA